MNNTKVNAKDVLSPSPEGDVNLQRHQPGPGRAWAGRVDRWLALSQPFMAGLGFLLAILMGYRDQIVPLLGGAPVDKALVLYNGLSDDLFYYLKIAQNILTGAGLTFDGITQTNGFHPLWMLVLVFLGRFFPIGSFAFALALIILVIALIAAASIAFRRLQIAVTGDQASFLPLIVFFLSALFVSRDGMEVGLVFLFLPLFLLAILKLDKNPSTANILGAGFVASLLILSRLDTILFVFLVLLAYLIHLLRQKRLASLWKKNVYFVCGLTPLFAYLLFNLVKFGNLIPISGRAKSLHLPGFVFSVNGFTSLVDFFTGEAYIKAFVVLTILAIPLIAYNLRKKMDLGAWIGMAVILYPFVFYAYYLVSSDWSFWLWYFYPLAFSCSLSVVLFDQFFFNRVPKMREGRKVLVLFIVAVLGVVTAAKYVRSIARPFSPNALLDAALQIQDFSLSHPGIYAMGDRAGIVAFLLPDPLLQTEGLVADKKFLGDIAAQRDLFDVLKGYDVGYYITTNPPKVGNCWVFEEPHLPGPYAPRMHGQACYPPALQFNVGDITTLVFKIH